MSELLAKKATPDASGRVTHITPENAGWTYIGFDVYQVASGTVVTRTSGDQEVCLVIVTGTATVTVGDQAFEKIGGRLTPFEDKAPGAVYLPENSEYTVTADSDIELAVCSAPGFSGHPVRLISGEQMSQEVRGEGTNTRHVRNILPDTDTQADSLLVVEVITPGGHWSSYPPHKHDQDAIPEESFLEETYYHRVSPSQGFGFQRVYTDDRSLDETMAVEDGDVVKVPRGYHPVGAPHGYDLYYLNVMAGPTRKWIFKNDPEHEWMLKK